MVTDLTDRTDRLSRLEALGALAEPLRRRAFHYVSSQGAPVNREAVAAALEVPRSVAAFHLDKLVDAGLLRVEYRRPPGRSGPGAGRPAKWYLTAEHDVALSVPERHYEVAASLLAQSLAREKKSGSARKSLAGIARRYGRALASGAELAERSTAPQRLKKLSQVLGEHGYEPRVAGGTLVLQNCPFREVAELSPELICSMNLELVQGVLDEVGDTSLRARLDPAPGRCCVTVTAER